jgi:parvulin-like peptidyl-prolyl isomerase
MASIRSKGLRNSRRPYFLGGGAALIAAAFALAPAFAADPEPKPSKAPVADARPNGQEVVATVDGDPIIARDFQNYLASYARRRLYHGGSPDEVRKLRAQALEQMIVDRLVVREARRRDLAADTRAVEAEIKALRDRYGTSPAWKTFAPRLPDVRRHMLEESRVRALRKEVERVTDPDPATLRSYYDRNIKKFIEPPRNHLSVILIGVDPSAPTEEVTVAKNKATTISQALIKGRDFAEMARKHSAHPSGPTGGDLGMVHEGQLSKSAQAAVDALNVNEISAPVRVLEGYVVLKLHARRKAEVRPFESVKERAISLYRRDRAAEQWQMFIGGLRRKATVVLSEPQRATGDGKNGSLE